MERTRSAAVDALPIPCTRCVGFGQLLECDPLNSGVICGANCKCPQVECGLCEKLGYQGCLLCGRPCTAEESQDWKDADGQWRCTECAASPALTQEVAAVLEDVEGFDGHPMHNQVGSECPTLVDMPAVSL